MLGGNINDLVMYNLDGGTYHLGDGLNYLSRGARYATDAASISLYNAYKGISGLGHTMYYSNSLIARQLKQDAMNVLIYAWNSDTAMVMSKLSKYSKAKVSQLLMYISMLNPLDLKAAIMTWAKSPSSNCFIQGMKRTMVAIDTLPAMTRDNIAQTVAAIKDQRDRLHVATEIFATNAYIVKHNLPLDTVLTGSELLRAIEEMPEAAVTAAANAAAEAATNAANLAAAAVRSTAQGVTTGVIAVARGTVNTVTTLTKLISLSSEDMMGLYTNIIQILSCWLNTKLNSVYNEKTAEGRLTKHINCLSSLLEMIWGNMKYVYNGGLSAINSASKAASTASRATLEEVKAKALKIGTFKRAIAQDDDPFLICKVSPRLLGWEVHLI